MAYAERKDEPKGPGELEYVFHEFHHSLLRQRNGQ